MATPKVVGERLPGLPQRIKLRPALGDLLIFVSFTHELYDPLKASFQTGFDKHSKPAIEYRLRVTCLNASTQIFYS